MTDEAGRSVTQGIAVLPPTTVRQIGSHQLLIDPSSVVKELIDNALDARAKCIFINISANTIDSIQVKDDGHGIPSEDRSLACRRYCTSKIRDFHDLKDVGGKWLGFRGEALASIADMSGTVSITTRVEGEPVAVKLKYQRNGELLSTERDSHPVGTTVKVTKLLESARVRNQLAIKGAVNCLAKIRRLVQAYALARPAVRFRLHVLKAKNDKIDFIYAPKKNANIEDAALKIIGKECALQCDWTALEANGFELQAFLPKPIAVGLRIANHGTFISIDARPVSAVRGSLKKIANAVRDRIRKANTSVREVKDPFFCLNIICPTDSYDPNIEPAKDDVIFGDEQPILDLVQRLLMTYYPDHTAQTDAIEDTNNVAHTELFLTSALEESSPQPCTPSSMQQDDSTDNIERPNLTNHSDQPCWRSSMYGIDEEDVNSSQNNANDVVREEEEGRLDASVSNPWTIARMNSPVKPRTLSNNGQLPSPAKSQSDQCSSNSEDMPDIFIAVDSRIPRHSSQTNVQASTLDEELQRGIQRLPQYNCADPIVPIRSMDQTKPTSLFEQRINPIFMESMQPHVSDANFLPPAARRRNQKPSKVSNNRPFVPPALQSDDSWFGRPMRNAPETSRPKKRPRQSDNNLHRTKSSTGPLNHVPYGFELHNLALIATTSVSSISKQMFKFGLRAQSLDWDCDSKDVLDAFASPVSEQQITEWVIKIDDMLSVAYEHEHGVEIRGALHEGIRCRLDMRSSEEGVRVSGEMPRSSSPVGNEKVSLITDKKDGVQVSNVEARDSDNTSLHVYPEHQIITVKPDEEEEDIDFSQFVDLDGNVGKQNTPVQDPDVEDDLGDGIDDEMLMDL
ncbi:hypothetical protein N0V94_001041 [Neodidymelliopsis sp. IMI 364377]|nr:hypothetical protein N0V94_001041 [Neodidymelliopsis sp. IMI 364377]